MIDVQTPWREPYAHLLARHVGRADERQAIDNAIARWRRGERPHPIYLQGPRGAGKSHLVSVALGELRADPSPDVRVLHVPEDVPPASTAADLLRRIDAADRGRFAGPTGGSANIGRAIVLLEGLDVHLRAMGGNEQKVLRHEWANGSWLLIATGCTYPDAMTSGNAAFYQAFSVWALSGLSDDEAGRLLDQLAGPVTSSRPTWPARRAALIRLSAGNPRALTTLGTACAADPDRWASDHLLAAVQQLSAHYQHRLRDLSPQHQHVLDVIVTSPVELTAPQIAERARIEPTSAAKACSRMRDDGVLSDRRDGHVTTWRVTEPMFRYWYEYRSATWEESRVALLGRLLESVLQPAEVIDLLLSAADEELGAAARAAASAPNVKREKHLRLLDAMDEGGQGMVPLVGLMDAEELLTTALVGCWQPRRRHAVLACGELLKALPTWAQEVARGFDGCTDKPKPRFLALVKAVQQAPMEHRLSAAWIVSQSLRTQLDQRGASWKQLGRNHARVVARTPFLRAWFLQRGKRTTDDPLLTPGDLLFPKRPSFVEDWTALAFAALRLDGDELLTALLHDRPPSPPLFAHPRPRAARPRDGAVLKVIVEGGADLRHESVLTWAAVLPHVPDDVADAVIHAVAALTPRARSTAAQDALAALLRLAHDAPELWLRVHEAMSAAAPWAQDLAYHAQTLLDLQARPQPTHVEIQAVLDALAATASRS